MAVSLTVLVIANIVALGLNSAQGYIWDAESGENTRSRRFVEPLVYINIGTPSINDIRHEGVGVVGRVRGKGGSEVSYCKNQCQMRTRMV